MKVPGKGEGSPLSAPSRQAGIAIGTVSNYGQIIGNRLRPESKLLDNACLVAHDLAPAIALNNTRADDALSQILVGSTDDYLAHTLVLCASITSWNRSTAAL